jgi:lipopolysaccharide transport protein LptA
MASSFRNLLICALAALVSPVLAAQNVGCHDAVVLDSGPFVLDRKTNLIKVQAPKITQCNVVITADDATATGIDFDAQSEWRFSGHVHVAVDGTTLTADSAVFTFADKRLARGELEGTAKFEDLHPEDGKGPISGGAGKLVYDDHTKTIQLSDNPWVHKDRYEIQGGCDLVYDLNDKGVTSGSTACEEKNKIRVLPPRDGEAPPAAPVQ